MRKFLAGIVLVALLPLSCVAATKSTVAELDALLANLNDQRKTDDAIATRLKEVDLAEQLTPAGISKLMQYKPGTATVRELLLLTVESALLPPPASEIPSQAPPDGAAQDALVKRAMDYVARELPRQPKLAAEKLSMRFQNGLAFIKNTSGNGSGMASSSTPAAISEPAYPTLIAKQTDKITTEAGMEQPLPIVKQKDPGGPMGQVPQGLPGLPLTTILSDAKGSPMTWLRWQTLNGRPTAVFTFSVPQKDSHYKLNYCCFPSMEHIGSGMGFEVNSGTLTTFHPYQAAPGYHGELYVDFATGVIMRVITKADMKPTDFVQQEDIRVDFGAVNVGGSQHLVPIKSDILLTVVPNGDAFVKFSSRRTLFDISYSKYQLASATGAH